MRAYGRGRDVPMHDVLSLQAGPGRSIQWLAACRGLAAVGVILIHYLPQIMAATDTRSWFVDTITTDQFDTGKFGVSMLFLISGYLTPASKRKRSAAEFCVDRAFRLYPIYWLAILLMGVFFAFDHYGPSTVLANLTMLQVFLGREDLIGLTWTMPIELLLYLGVLLFDRRIDLWRIRYEGLWDYRSVAALHVLMTLAAVALALVRRLVWTSAPVAVPLLLSIALLGQILRLHQEGIASRRQAVLSIAVFEAGLTAASLLAYQVDVGHQENWHRYVLSYTTALCIFLLFRARGIAPRILVWISVISYPVYLLQEPVFRLAFGRAWMGGIDPWIFTVCVMTVLVLVSMAVHVWIERPCVELGRDMERSWKARREGAV